MNVGGHGKLPMAPFREALSDQGLTRVRSYIQSGNIACNGPDSPEALLASIASALARFDLDRPAHILSADALGTLIASTPDHGTQANRVMAYLHPDQADPTDCPLSPTETLTPLPGATILDAPDGIGRSKAAPWLDRTLPQPVTARNLATLRATHALFA